MSPDMPLTNAQKQAAYAARRKIKLQRLAVLEAFVAKVAAANPYYVAGGEDLYKEAQALTALNAADRFELENGA